MGVVYKARDLKLDRTVALKFLPSELTTDPESKRRFIHEAKAASALQHNNICTVHDIDETASGQSFMVLEFCEGETLKSKIERGPLRLRDTLDLTLQIARGLEQSHRHGIIHRDIKPANIIINSEGVAKIVDFGVAKLLGQTVVTGSKSVLGTTAYMSPEQARCEPVDSRTDIWSLGIVLYEMLAGHRPFDSVFDQALVYAILNVEPSPVSALRTDAPRGLDEVLATALAKEASKRYQRVEDFAEDIALLREGLPPTKGLEGGEGTTKSVKTSHRPTSKLSPRSKQFVQAIGLLAVVAGIAWLFFPRAFIWTGGTPQKLKLTILPVQLDPKSTETSHWSKLVGENLLPDQLSSSQDVAVVSPAHFGIDDKVGATAQVHEKAVQEGADYLLEATIYRTTGSYNLQVNLVEAKNGVVRFPAKSDFAGEAQLDQAVAAVARQILYFLDLRVIHPSNDKDLQPWIPARLKDIRAEKAFIDAAVYIYTGDPGGGRWLEDVLKLDSTFIAPRVWIVVGHAAAGYMESARKHYEVLKLLEPNATPFEKAMIEYSEACLISNPGERRRAQVRTLEKALLYAPGNRILLVNLGAHRYNLEDYEGALREFEPVVKSEMPFPPVYPWYARTLLRLERKGEARDALKRALEVKPVDAETFGLLTALETANGDTNAARQYENLYFRRNRDFGTSLAEGNVTLGEAFLLLGARAEAITYFRRAIVADSAAADPHAQLANVYFLSGNRNEALREAKAALSIDSTARLAHLVIGTLFDELRDYPSAIAHYSAYLSQSSQTTLDREKEQRLTELRSMFSPKGKVDQRNN
jgi:serine/threonine protein kinase/Tfp pilus assembly protein PilF